MSRDRRTRASHDHRHDRTCGFDGLAKVTRVRLSERDPMHDLPAIVRVILDGYALHPHGPHGVVHWARVLENGLKIAEANGADAEVVTLFALFHDSRRVDDDEDPGHGLRGAKLALSLRGELVHLDGRRFELLYEACRLHTDGLTTGDRTLLACWDADRLDLGRVGITPDPDLLGTKAARTLIPWAHLRAIEEHEPTDVLAAWGVPGMRR
jgi:uncharacterized protein